MKQLKEKILEVKEEMRICSLNNDKEKYWELHTLKVELENKKLIQDIKNGEYKLWTN